MSVAAALAAIGAKRDDPDALSDLASQALAEGEEEQVVPLLTRAALGRGNDARLFQWVGLLHRSLDQHEEALEAFDAAARLAPGDGLIAHGRARVAMEAGIDARQLYETALRLSPSGDVVLGLAAARFAMGERERALRELAQVLATNPQWAEGHVQWAQLASMCGRSPSATDTVKSALQGRPDDANLWLAAIAILTKGDRFEEAWQLADRAAQATGQPELFAFSRATGLSDAGHHDRAATAFAAMGEPTTVQHAIGLARHQVRTKDWEALSGLADRWMNGENAHHFWPYASICWRVLDDPRWAWLEGDDRLIRVADLAPKLPPLGKLSDRLRSLHEGSGRFLDQSVRGGTQTDGPLFSRIEPEIRALRAAVVDAVEQYRAQLPPVDPSHPMLRFDRRRKVRFAGSWSVRLAGEGYHSHHVHPQGWISSAFYASVPDDLGGEEGQLILGVPQADLDVSLPAIRRIEPRPGRLILFPSMMWHGTQPFAKGERLTVAFDVAPPR